VRLPRDTGGPDLARRLAKCGYTMARQTGSHLKLTSNHNGPEHQLTITTSPLLRMGTLNNILVEVAAYLGIEKDALAATLFAS
jgi:predicted RNA binding protein YcfA (HicA-like mRNA interferase family)